MGQITLLFSFKLKDQSQIICPLGGFLKFCVSRQTNRIIKKVQQQLKTFAIIKSFATMKTFAIIKTLIIIKKVSQPLKL